MIVEIVPSWRTGCWQVLLRQGCLFFRLDGGDQTKYDAEWMAKMFRRALKIHNSALLKKVEGRVVIPRRVKWRN